METIAFVQLSDLHIGHQMTSPGGGMYGYGPHDVALVEPLWVALRKIASSRGMSLSDLPIVATGDVTAAGSNNDFALAATLLHHRVTVRHGHSPLGLDLPPLRASIAGNHDHWAGKDRIYSGFFQRQYNTDLKPTFLPACPCMVSIGKPGVFEIQLFTIDSNPRVKGHINWNLFAGGGFDATEWKEFRRCVRSAGDIRRSEGIVVRAVLCHHALDNVPEEPTWWNRLGFRSMPLPLYDRSRKMLQKFAAKPAVDLSAVLTGHNHLSLLKPWSDEKAGSRLFHEFRASAALAGPASESNGFFLHEITKNQANEVHWLVKDYRYEQAGTFEWSNKSQRPIRVK